MTKPGGQGAPAILDVYADEDVGSPPSLFPDYRSTALRSPLEAPLHISQTLTEVTGPAGSWDRLMGDGRGGLDAAACRQAARSAHHRAGTSLG